jgi:uncharacterized RDD family membrane protein YckC
MSTPDTLMSPRARQGERSAAMRDIVTPEGVPIGFELAGTGDRAAAFLLDVVIQAAILIALAIAFSYAGMSSELLKPILIILEFLIQNFYFAFFEIRWQGQTPGKRKIGIRVIDARGGQLDTGAVLARNLVRELEVWTPLRFLVLNRMMWPDAPGWALLIAGAWTFVFLLMPLFNKDKLRVGDLIGGTRVVRQPKIVLLPDLVREAQVSMQRRAVVQPSFTFSDDQLAIYGIYELQVLEDVLRQDQSKMGYYDSVSVVCDKIREKIGYVGRIESSERFLKDFYVALRAHLESKMLFGQRKADKYAK